MIDFTLGEMPFPLKEFAFKGFFNDKTGFISEFTMSMRIKIPIFMNKRFITKAKTIEAKLIKH